MPLLQLDQIKDRDSAFAALCRILGIVRFPSDPEKASELVSVFLKNILDDYKKTAAILEKLGDDAARDQALRSRYEYECLYMDPFSGLSGIQTERGRAGLRADLENAEKDIVISQNILRVLMEVRSYNICYRRKEELSVRRAISYYLDLTEQRDKDGYTVENLERIWRKNGGSAHLSLALAGTIESGRLSLGGLKEIELGAVAPDPVHLLLAVTYDFQIQIEQMRNRFGKPIIPDDMLWRVERPRTVGLIGALGVRPMLEENMQLYRRYSHEL